MMPSHEVPSYLLNKFAKDVFSQTGEDGVIERILDVLGVTDGWCVEFGAWDGLHVSNCANLIRNKGYSGIFLEPNPVRFAQLQKNYADFPKVTAINSMVGFGAADGLDTLVTNVPIPADFDVLSIDIDGNDYHVWKAITRLRPKLVCIEFNPTIPNEVEFTQPADPSVQQGSSLAALVRLGKTKGYELICATAWNGFFVDGQYFDRFGVLDNSVFNLRRDLSWITYMFSGYDGRVMLAGNQRLLWHDLPMSDARAQQLPARLLGFPDDYSPFQKFLFTRYKKWRLRHD